MTTAKQQRGEGVVERAAIALWEQAAVRAGCPRPVGWTFEQEPAELQESYREDARSVLRAIREPSPAQIDRFVSRALCVSISDEGSRSAYARNQWQVMIDAALAEP